MGNWKQFRLAAHNPKLWAMFSLTYNFPEEFIGKNKFIRIY